jgi:hypothetical protein
VVGLGWGSFRSLKDMSLMNPGMQDAPVSSSLADEARPNLNPACGDGTRTHDLS